MRNTALLAPLLILVLLGACKDSEKLSFPNEALNIPENPPVVPYLGKTISTDKATYNPGEPVTFYLENLTNPGQLSIRYKHLNQTIYEEQLSTLNWQWTPPQKDFSAYMVEIIEKTPINETVYCTIGIDVSSDWTRFPRYGFLSKFPAMTQAQCEKTIKQLNRYHINGLQFYDWHYKHHQPLCMIGTQPANSWNDIINREISFRTLELYISAAHKKNIKTMFYNLAFGAFSNAEQEDVNEEWYIFKDKAHTQKDAHELPQPPFVSDIYLLNPANKQWQDYLINENEKIYNHLNFDGYHIDQLGDRGPRYTYDGHYLNLADTYASFIEANKKAHTNKYLVMNAVNQYGQDGIASATSDFLYTEVWSPNDTYNHLANIIKNNNALSDNTKNTVLAAYMNYDLANEKNTFNTPAVLMCNAVIFAFGGAHLELGEHMLGKEYFPNNNLQMSDELKNNLIDYYDFMVAYQNLLRDGGQFTTAKIKSLSKKTNVMPWPGTTGSVAAISKQFDNRQVVHLINSSQWQTLYWRDNNGTHNKPQAIKNTMIELETNKTVKKLWYASPDLAGGAAIAIKYLQEDNRLLFQLPQLNYWTMVVLEYENN